MYDLPTDTKTARRDYALFRKRLLIDGFQLMPYPAVRPVVVVIKTPAVSWPWTKRLRVRSEAGRNERLCGQPPERSTPGGVGLCLSFEITQKARIIGDTLGFEAEYPA